MGMSEALNDVRIDLAAYIHHVVKFSLSRPGRRRAGAEV
jgi:hypothetical protein